MIARPAIYLWVGPTTCLGLLFLVLPWPSRCRAAIITGVLEIHGGAAAWFLENCTMLPGGALAMTLGHVVIGRNPAALDLSRKHEHIHVRQCERWGPLFVPAYLSAGLVALLRSGSPYRDNAFEREAFGRGANGKQAAR